MRSAGPALRRLLHTHRTAKLTRRPVVANARRSVLMRELEDSRQEERADQLESELPAGAARAMSCQGVSLRCARTVAGKHVQG